MLKSTARAIRALLDGERILSLAVLVDGAPFAGLLPFVPTSNYSGVIIHASRLSRHTAGLAAGARAAVLLHEQDGPEKDPLQIKRASFECDVHPLERNGEDLDRRARALPRALPGQPHHVPIERLHALPARVPAGTLGGRIRSRGGHRASRHREAGLARPRLRPREPSAGRIARAACPSPRPRRRW